MSSDRMIDEIDAKILKELLKDGRKRFIEIAREAHVSKDVISQHYINMKKEGIIVGSTIQLNYAALGYDVAASFFIDVPPRQQQQTIEHLRKIPGLYDAYRWGSHSRLWAVSDLMKAEQIDYIKQLIKKLPSVLKLEVEVWIGSRDMPDNLSVLTNDKISSDIEKTEAQTKNRIEENLGEIDEIDRKLIEKLTVDGRASFDDIGRELGISASTAMRRYHNLKHSGIIRTVIQVNPAKIGYLTMACFRLTIDYQGNLNSIVEKIAKIPDVVGLFKTTGAYDLTIMTEIKNFEHFFALETEIANIDGIREMETAALNRFPILPYAREHISTF